MKQLIADIKARLAEKVTALRYIDEDWGQLDYYASDAPVKWPCVLIDVDQTPWTNQGSRVQMGMAQLSLRFADLKLSNTNPKAPAGQRTAAASIYDVMQTAFKHLHGWTASSANGPLTRTLTRKVNREDGIREFEVIYSVQLLDTDAKPVYTAYPMTPEKITFRMGLVAPGSGELTPPYPGGGGIIPPDPGTGGGDMTKAVYDPDNIAANAFNADNHVNGTTNKVFTATEKTKLSSIESGADVTDSTNVEKAGAVMKDGDITILGIKSFSSFPVTPSSSPVNDYQVANKKYVDSAPINADAITDGVNNKTYSSTEKTKLAGIAVNANNYAHPNHSGDVTSAGDGATTIASGAITYNKLNSSLIQRRAVSTNNIDWSTAGVFTKTISSNTTFTFSNLQLNKVITLMLSGNYTVQLPSYCKRISGTYSGGVSNYIQFHCTNATSGSEEVWYTISQQL